MIPGRLMGENLPYPQPCNVLVTQEPVEMSCVRSAGLPETERVEVQTRLEVVEPLLAGGQVPWQRA